MKYGKKPYTRPETLADVVELQTVICTSPGTERVIEEGDEEGFDW